MGGYSQHLIYDVISENYSQQRPSLYFNLISTKSLWRNTL
jgi:hypothetical protein